MKKNQIKLRVYFGPNVIKSLFMIERGAPRDSDWNGGMRHYPGSNLGSRFVERLEDADKPFVICSDSKVKTVLAEKLLQEDEMGKPGDDAFFEKWWSEIVDVEAEASPKPFPTNRISKIFSAHRLLRAHWAGAAFFVTDNAKLLDYGKETTMKYADGATPNGADPIFLSTDDFGRLDLEALNKRAVIANGVCVLPEEITKESISDFLLARQTYGSSSIVYGRGTSLGGNTQSRSKGSPTLNQGRSVPRR